MIERHQRFYARQLFELRVRQSKGEAYQELFNGVMAQSDTGFVSMRPYGRYGDRKNDGYIPSLGRFFQVYAPRDPKSRLATAASKAAKDFAGLHKFWSATHSIKSYRFAFNDEYSGSVVPVEQALAAIAKSHSIEARVFLAKDLETLALELPLEKLERAIGIVVPDPGEMETADYAALRDVIENVMRSPVPSPPTGKLLAPEFNEKVAFNGLTEQTGDLLRVAARQSDVVADFFSNRSGTHRQDLRDHLADFYTKESTVSDNADQVFFALLQRITPSTHRSDRQVINAALIVMAFYFEACDIFESPDAPA